MPIFQTQTDTIDILKNIADEQPDGVEWPAYAEVRNRMADHPDEHREQILNRKRAHALRYLGARKKRLAGGYSKVESRVFTPEFVSELGQANSTRRAMRNPWLGRSQTGRHDAETASSSAPNVLPFGPQPAADAGTSAS